MIPIYNLIQHHDGWLTIKGWTNEGTGLQQTLLKRALATGKMTATGTPPSSPPAPAPLVPVVWNVELPLKTEPACSFHDVFFGADTQFNSGMPAKSVALGSPVPADPVQTSVRVFMVNVSGFPIVPGGETNSMRFVKMVSADLPSGEISYPLTATFADGTTEEAELRVMFS